MISQCLQKIIENIFVGKSRIFKEKICKTNRNKKGVFSLAKLISNTA